VGTPDSSRVARRSSPDRPFLINRSSPCVELCSGATVSILRPSIDRRTAPRISGQDNADAEAMIRATLQGTRFIEKLGNLAADDARG
jgi:hypothetical protein